MKRIIWKMPNGTVMITTPTEPIRKKETEEKYLDRIAAKLKELHNDSNGNMVSAIPQEAVRVADLPEKNMPTDKEFREAWTWKTSKPAIDIDMEKARTINLNRIRLKRDEKLKELDVEVMKNITSPKKIEKIEKEKQRLRDLPAALKTQLNKCKTVKDFKLIKVEI